MVQDMEWCQKYAFENRAAMLRSMVECVEEITGKTPDMTKSVNIHHNYCSCERCQYKVNTLSLAYVYTHVFHIISCESADALP